MYCLLHLLIQQEVFAGSWWADEGREEISEPSQLVCPTYVELLKVMKRALLLG